MVIAEYNERIEDNQIVELERVAKALAFLSLDAQAGRPPSDSLMGEWVTALTQDEDLRRQLGGMFGRIFWETPDTVRAVVANLRSLGVGDVKASIGGSDLSAPSSRGDNGLHPHCNGGNGHHDGEDGAGLA